MIKVRTDDLPPRQIPNSAEGWNVVVTETQKSLIGSKNYSTTALHKEFVRSRKRKPATHERKKKQQKGMSRVKTLVLTY